MEKNWLALFNEEKQIKALMAANEYSSKYGLVLSEKDAKQLMLERHNALQEQQRIEFGRGIIMDIIDAFCSSDYLDQSNYVSTLIRLQEIFYLYKNEMHDEISDHELLHFMREQFETICYGDLTYLEGTCLSIFSQAVRAGYRGYQNSDGYGEYAQFDEVPRWDKELFLETLRDLCWR